MNQFRKKSMSIILALLMVFSIIPSTAYADDTQLESKVTISTRIEADETTISPKTEYEIDKFDLTDYGISENPSYTTALHALLATLEDLGLDPRDKEILDITSGGYIISICGAGDSSLAWMYMVNGKVPDNESMIQYALKEGDNVVFFCVDWLNGYITHFDKEEAEVSAGETLSLTLSGESALDIAFGIPANTVSIADSVILISGNGTVSADNPTEFKTNDTGESEIIFNEPGTYLLSASRYNLGKADISRPYCKVTVTDAPEQKPYLEKTIDYYTEKKKNLILPIEVVAVSGVGKLSDVTLDTVIYKKDTVTNTAQSVLATMSSEIDPANINGTNFAKMLIDAQMDGGLFAAITDNPEQHAIAVLGMDVAGLTYNTEEFPSRNLENALTKILENQEPDGSYKSEGNAVEGVAMSIIALAGYAGQPAYRESITKAIAYLKNIQLDTGGFSGGSGPETSKNLALVISALTVAGEDLFTWTKGGGLIESLSRFQLDDGSFRLKLTDMIRDDDATAHALIALGDSQYGVSAWRKFKKVAITDESIVEADRAILSLGDLSDITSDIILPLNGTNGSSIAWFSSQPGIITNEGKITRPSSEQGNKTVTLTAIITKGIAKAEKEFIVTVRALPAPEGITAQGLLEKSKLYYDVVLTKNLYSWWDIGAVKGAWGSLEGYKTPDYNNKFTANLPEDFAGRVFGMLAVGMDPRTANDQDIIKDFARKQNFDGSFSSLINQHIWAVIAFSAVDANEIDGYNKIGAVQYILDAQSADGKIAGLDLTGMALVALSGNRDIAGVNKAIANAVNYIKTEQLKSGRFSGGWGNNGNTLGTVVSGLASIGEELTSDKWTVNGKNPVIAIGEFQHPNGGFRLGADDKDSNSIASYQCIVALGDVIRGNSVWLNLGKITASADKTELNRRIAEVESTLKGEYTDESWTAFQTALNTAKLIATGNTSTQSQIDNAVYDMMTKHRALTTGNIEDIDVIPPVIYTTAKDETVTNNYYYFQANAQDNVDGKLAVTVKLNGNALTGSNDSFLAVLNTGANIIEISAKDYSNNNTVMKLEVIYTHSSVITDDITVNFTLTGDNGAEWITKTTVSLKGGDSVYDAFVRILGNNNLKYEEKPTGYIHGIQIPGTNNYLREFDRGPNSGWLFKVNGVQMDVSFRYYLLSEGDNIVWFYTGDYQAEPGYSGSGMQSGNVSISKDSDGFVTLGTLTAARDNNGIATATMSGATLTNIVTAIESIENAAGTTAKITIDLPADISGFAFKLPREIIRALSNKNNLSLNISTGFGLITLDPKTISIIAKKSSVNGVLISMNRVSAKLLLEEVKELIGDHPVYDLNIIIDEKPLKTFDGGKITVLFPYELRKKERAEKMKIFYIAGEGAVKEIQDAEYDSQLKGMKFSTDHFSMFAIVNTENNMENKTSKGVFERTSLVGKFKDVPENHWAKEYIDYLAERDFISGVGGNLFAPEKNITRAEFVTILFKMCGDELPKAKTKFADVRVIDWYAPYVEWAYEKGIASGISESAFSPDSMITRQDMAVIIKKFMNIKGYTMSKTNAFSVFEDNDSIAEYAKDSVAYLRQAGIISGIGNNLFAPRANVKRSETAKILASILMAQYN